MCMRDTLIRGLCRQRESGEYCDVLIISENEVQLTVHSNVLAVSSVYFSDITRNSSSLLPHIPFLRVGEYVTLSATLQTSEPSRTLDIRVS